jgi:neutral ceramidase
LNAYINLTLTYLHHLDASSTSQPPPGPFPPDNVNKSLSFVTGVMFDGTPIFKQFGEVKKDVKPSYPIGSIVSATFVGANPRNSLRLEQTYAAVEKLNAEYGRWARIRDDSDWSLVFNWKRTSEILGTSEVAIAWETEDWVEPGQYRIKYYGDWKAVGGTITAVGGTITAFEGTSGEFVLT